MTLSAEQQAEVNAAITAAETGTRGEIFCVIAQDSSDYAEVPLAAGAIAAIVLPALLVLLGFFPFAEQAWRAAHVAAGQWELAALAVSLLTLQGVLFAIAFLIALPAPVRLFLAPLPLKRMRVRQHALEQFLAKNLHRTAERTGVLIYVSLDEHKAELIADEGITTQSGVWEAPMAALIASLKQNDLKGGLIAAVQRIGAILTECAPAGPENRNEIPDAVVVLPRL